MGPWTDHDIRRARSVPLIRLLDHLCDFVKEARDYTPLVPSCGSRRFQVNCLNRDFRLIVTGEKWVDELVERGSSGRGGGGAIDLAGHLTGANFVQSVRICLDAADSVTPHASNPRLQR